MRDAADVMHPVYVIHPTYVIHPIYVMRPIYVVRPIYVLCDFCRRTLYESILMSGTSCHES